MKSRIKSAAKLLQLPTDKLRPNPAQPRQIFDKDDLQELAESIKQHGILQPLTVRRTAQGYELVAGERRLRAAQLAGLRKVPCLLTEADEEESGLLALVENLQRKDLHYFEEAHAIAAFLEKSGLTQEEVARRLCLSPSALANKLRLLRLSPDCAGELLRHGLSERHARALLRLSDEEARKAALSHIVNRNLNAAQTEDYIGRMVETLQTTPPPRRSTYIIKDVRLFLNSVDRGLRMIREAGVSADCGREDTESEILLTIRIPKNERPGQ